MQHYALRFIQTLLMSCITLNAWADLQITTTNWQLQSKERISLMNDQYVYVVEATNTGSPLKEVTAELTESSHHTEILQGSLSFGDVNTGETSTSSSLVVIKQNHWHRFNPNTLDIEFTTTSAPSGSIDEMFNPNRVIEINVNMAEEDFAILKEEGRTLASADRECLADYEYTTFVADVTIDGYTVTEVEIRKKGFLGSLSKNRPSLKLDFSEHVKGRTFNEMKRMTLNNNRQDASHARQCMAYDIYRKSGIAAPRCNLARVSVNGEYMGVYTHVENIKKPFLEHSFGDKDGNLYEAQIADFGTHLNDKFEKKTNKKENDRTDLSAISEALSLDDGDFITAISSLIDIEEFIRYWAIDTLLGNWDSATGNANNYYIYRNPNDGLFHYIPWGTDLAFTGSHDFHPDSGPLYRNIKLASRLYANEQYKAKYHATLALLMETIWNEEALLAEIDRIQQLTGAPDSAYQSLKTFIAGAGQEGEDGHVRSQRDLISSAIAGLEPNQIEHLVADVAPDCSLPETTTLTASVQSLWGVDTGTFSFTNRDGRAVTASLFLASLQVDSLEYSVNNETLPSVVSLLLIGVDAADNMRPYVLQVYVEAPDYTPGDHSLHGLATNVALLDVDPNNPASVTPHALGATGTITLHSIGGPFVSGNVKMSINAELEFSSTDTAE